MVDGAIPASLQIREYGRPSARIDTAPGSIEGKRWCVCYVNPSEGIVRDQAETRLGVLDRD